MLKQGETDLAFGAVSGTGRAKKLRNTSLEAEKVLFVRKWTNGCGDRGGHAQSSKGNRACEKTSKASVITLVLKRTPELRRRGGEIAEKKVSVGILFLEASKKLAHTDSS